MSADERGVDEGDEIMAEAMLAISREGEATLSHFFKEQFRQEWRSRAKERSRFAESRKKNI